MCAVLSAVTEPCPQRPSWSVFLPAKLTLICFPIGLPIILISCYMDCWKFFLYALQSVWFICLFMYKIVLPACVYKHCVCTCRAQGRHYLLELNLQTVVSCPMGVLQEQWVLLTMELSLQPLRVLFYFCILILKMYFVCICGMHLDMHLHVCVGCMQMHTAYLLVFGGQTSTSGVLCLSGLFSTLLVDILRKSLT